MTTLFSSINLCPINFNALEKVNRVINNLDAVLLFSKLKFHQANSKLTKDGEVFIARSRKQLSEWFGFSKKKIDSLLNILVNLGLIKKQIGLWYGKKALFISTSEEIDLVPINMQLLEILCEEIGSLRATLVFSKIAFAFANTTIEHQTKKWCCLNKQKLADWTNLSIRTIDDLLEKLIKKGVIIKQNFVWQEKNQSHFHIPEFAIETLVSRFQNRQDPLKKPEITKEVLPPFSEPSSDKASKIELPESSNTLVSNSSDKNILGLKTLESKTLPEQSVGSSLDSLQTNSRIPIIHDEQEKSPPTEPNPQPIEAKKNDANRGECTLRNLGQSEKDSTQNCREQPAKKGLSIKIRTKTKKANNNTSENLSTLLQSKGEQKTGDIIFNQIQDTLSDRQLKYIAKAIENTIKCNKLNLSNPAEIFEQVKFSILNPCQRNGVTSFQHAVSRFMKILAYGNWRTPIGFHSHSAYGQNLKAGAQAREERWAKQKSEECARAKDLFQAIESSGAIAISYPSVDSKKIELTTKAIALVEKISGLAKKAALSPESLVIKEMIKDSFRKLESFILKGADKTRIFDCLQACV